MVNFFSGNTLIHTCESENIKISRAMALRETVVSEISLEEVYDGMRKALKTMKECIEKSKSKDLNMLGGFIGGESAAMHERLKVKGPLCGTASKAAAYAMGVLEVNASMGRIVAAPTAGASGVVPGVLIALQEDYGFSDDELVDALLNAGAIGYIVARNAFVAGAQGGCQAEVGTACAMAASAVVELFGGTPAECLTAAGDALSNILGLVCDPICGLVESPCQKRNAMGVANALISAEISLATNGKYLVPFDEVVDAMKEVGESMPTTLRETALGGMANTTTGKNIRREAKFKYRCSN